ncbi:MAG: 3-oxoadipate CoA-transferase subunit A [Alphaproteobacteria bacterium MarineAlpha11_Bin1]|nr:MAG: 3-oxoadipate CoA-transferase subunit A [Alphaproteobacteria bacterium MarineAlpha11_Bin1]|tara:strand:- start:8299 stop:9024 length:726 start_codon:yes stop_codon:yes gene_type:complete
MIDKRTETPKEAVSLIQDGAVILISGFGESGNPTELTHALIDHGSRELTIVNNNAGNGHVGLAALLECGLVRKMICSFPRSSHSEVFETMYRDGRIELEMVPQGTLAERIRAAGAGIGGFYTRTTVGTPLAEGKERRIYKGEEFVLEDPLHADFALVKADLADRWGNLTYRLAARNFGPIMCTAAKNTIVQARKIVDLGEIPPEQVVTPGIYVDQVVEVPYPVSESEMIQRDFRYLGQGKK